MFTSDKIRREKIKHTCSLFKTIWDLMYWFKWTLLLSQNARIYLEISEDFESLKKYHQPNKINFVVSIRNEFLIF